MENYHLLNLDSTKNPLNVLQGKSRLFLDIHFQKKLIASKLFAPLLKNVLRPKKKNPYLNGTSLISNYKQKEEFKIPNLSVESNQFALKIIASLLSINSIWIMKSSTVFIKIVSYNQICHLEHLMIVILLKLILPSRYIFHLFQRFNHCQQLKSIH